MHPLCSIQSSDNTLAISGKRVAPAAVEHLKQDHLRSPGKRLCAGGVRERLFVTANPKESIQRFLDYIDIDEQTGCWNWSGFRHDFGYGYVKFMGRAIGVHRVMWFLIHGAFNSKPFFVLHHCDNPPCCNPDHLFLGTQKDNLHDAATKLRMALGERHWGCILTTEDVVNIRSRYVPRSSSESAAALAREYGVSPANISSIIRRKSWRHVI